jgi:hypothetical protein
MAQPGTSFSTPLNSTVDVQLTDKNGNIMLAYGTAPSATAGYAVGCMFIVTSSGKVFSNTGTVASCTFTAVSTA